MEIDRKHLEEKPEFHLYAPSQSCENIANSPSIKGSDVSGRTNRLPNHLNTETSFTDNLIDLFEGCRDEMFELKRKNRKQREEISMLKIEACKWRRVAESYIVNWDDLQDELKTLKNQLVGVETSKEEMMEELKLKENERRMAEKRLEEREKEVCEQKEKLDLLEKGRLEMEVRIEELEKTQLESKEAGQKPDLGGGLISAVKGVSKTSTSHSEAIGHLSKMNESLVNEPVSHQRLLKARKPRVLPNSVSIQSTAMYRLPCPPKSSGLPKGKPRQCVRKLIPLQLI